MADNFRGRNVWGALPYAEAAATFGGKLGSLVGVDGVLYGIGRLWTQENSTRPTLTGAAGTLTRIVYSYDLGHSWNMVEAADRDLYFVQFGRDRANAPGGWLYAYYGRPGDTTHLYLQRIPKSQMPGGRHDSAEAGNRETQFLMFASRSGAIVAWSPREQDAIPVFSDSKQAFGPVAVNDAALGRYLLTLGHDTSGRIEDASPGQLGMFEAPYPWGPWRTLYYADDWGAFPARTRGDYLGLTFPANWISPRGDVLWGIYSGPGPLDAFNLVRTRLLVRRGFQRQPDSRALDLASCRETRNAVNGSNLMVCPPW